MCECRAANSLWKSRKGCPAADADRLIDPADKALNRVKSQARGTWTVFGATDSRVALLPAAMLQGGVQADAPVCGSWRAPTRCMNTSKAMSRAAPMDTAITSMRKSSPYSRPYSRS